MKEIRGLESRKRYAEADPRARADHLPLRRESREAAARALRGAARPPGQGRARHRGPPLLQPPRPRPVPPRGRRRPQPPRRQPTSRAASTITQQLCKNFFLTPEKHGFKRKAQEAILAFVLERRAEKKDILELYLNEIYLGQSGSFSINGVGEAARMYFHKDVSNLTLPESALLAGMIQSPNPYNPYRHSQRAIERRNEVIRAMNEAGFIDASTMDAALAAPLQVESDTVDTADAPYFVDLVRPAARPALRLEGPDHPEPVDPHHPRPAAARASPSRRSRRGLDAGAEARSSARTAVRSRGASSPSSRRPARWWPSSAAARTGRSQYNRVTQARRQPGSTFKPFVYLAAFEATFDDPALPPITPATVVEDAPAGLLLRGQGVHPAELRGQVLRRT